MKAVKLSQKAVSKAVREIKKGKVVVFPTDTVYGFLADAGNMKAVEKIYEIKKRPRSKPLPVFVFDMDMAKEIADISEKQEKILKKYWPGKYTFVLKANPKVNLSKLVVGKGKTIALRIPKYKPLNSLLKKVNMPLAETSVNISGKPPLMKIEDISKVVGEILVIDGGELRKGKPSKVIDLTKNGKVLRY